MALTIDIGRPGPDGSLQRSPEWMLAFVPFKYRDTRNSLNPGSMEEAVATRPPIVVTSDCVAMQVSESKAQPTGSLQAVLRGGNINYGAAVAPGDFVFAWMSSTPDRLTTVEAAARAGRPCNGYGSGLKFFGRVMSVRERLSVDPSTGVKQLVYNVVGSSFWEMTTKVYFNPILFKNVRPLNFITDLVASWTDSVGPNGLTNSQDLVALFLNVFMGTGPRGQAKSVGGISRSPNAAFVVPAAVASMLGRKSEKEKATHKYTDILDVVAGVQKYSSSGNDPDANPWAKLQPDMGSDQLHRRQKTLAKKISGDNVNLPNAWDSTPVWSLLNSYANTVVNEIFTTTRVDGNGDIVPTLVLRQIPFTTPEYIRRLSGNKKTTSAQQAVARRFTNFFELPRWRPNPSSVYEADVGRTDAARINFVQVWGLSNAIERTDFKLSSQVEQGNFFVDDNDVRRSGVRMHSATSYFDYVPQSQTTASQAPVWAQWVADWIVNGHLKYNGTLSMCGVDEPIAIGDNVEWRGVVYHIEQVSHICSVSGDGTKTFRTSVALSNGLDSRSESADVTVYPGMSLVNRENLTAEDDVVDGGLLPGYSDAQATTERGAGGERGADRPDENLTVVKAPPRRKGRK